MNINLIIAIIWILISIYFFCVGNLPIGFIWLLVGIINLVQGIRVFRRNKKLQDMMDFYGFELEDKEYWDKAGLCLVYPKEYLGTENERKLMNVLDEAAKSFKKKQ